MALKPTPLILVMCTGNVCRSPMAEAYFQKCIAFKAINAMVISKGLNAPAGRPPHPFAIELAAQNGAPINENKKAEKVESADLINANAVFVMDNGHRHEIQRNYSSASGKTFLLGHWQQREIADPIFAPRSAFESAWRDIQQGVDEWIERMLKAGLLNRHADQSTR